MSEQLSEKELRLERELAAAREELVRLRADRDQAEAEFEHLRRRRPTAAVLERVRNDLAELASLEPLEDASPFDGTSLGDEQRRGLYYGELVQRIKSQLDDFRARYAAAEARLDEARRAVTAAERRVDALAAQLELARPAVRTRTVVRKGADGVERVFVVVYRRDALMPWSESEADRRRLRRTVARVLLLCLLISLIMPWIPVPEPERVQVVEIPERIVQMVETRPPPPPPPPPPPKKGESKAPEKKPEKLRPRERAPEPTTEVARKAREKAARSGLLAFRESFTELMDNPAETKLGKDATLTSGEVKAQRTQRSLVTAAAGLGSGGIDTAALSRDVAGTGLAGRGTSRVTGVIGAEFGDAERPIAESVRGSRTDEEIQLVFDRNKAALYRIYQRALRVDPTLQGKLVLKITILPSGEVSAVSVVSSDLGDPELEAKIVARVKLFRFEPKDVDTVTIVYPIDFLPA
ncbi:MAG: hypothetical protein KatS3mg121_0272 [Gammaproteobacteria bacterium]|nr:MAG: hypothetical protein KatS3mg121_0272 [Gammaproteobacteria bacterium]